MAVECLEPKPANAWLVGECLPIFHTKYGRKFGKRQILKLLRLNDVIDLYNNVQQEYQELQLFQHQAIEIIGKKGKVVNRYRKLFLTKKGIEFVGELLQRHPNVRLSEGFCEFLTKFKLNAIEKEVSNL